jgi:hypothetical protein
VTREATNMGELRLLALDVPVHGKRGEEGYKVRQNKGKVKDSNGRRVLTRSTALSRIWPRKGELW